MDKLERLANEVGSVMGDYATLADIYIRDGQLGISQLEEIQNINLRMDRWHMREKARWAAHQIQAEMDKAHPDQGTILQLLFMKTILLSDIDVSRDGKALDALVRALDKIHVSPEATDVSAVEF